MKKFTLAISILLIDFFSNTNSYVLAQTYPGQSSEVKSIQRVSKIFGASTVWTTAAGIPVQNDWYYSIWGEQTWGQ